jgi:uncharacterized protein (TIGR02466 family)
MVKNLFSTLLYFSPLVKKSKKSDLQRFELADEIKKIQNSDLKGQQWSQKNYFAGYTSYGSMDRLDLFSTSFADLEKQIRPHVIQYAESLHWDVKPKELVLNSMWVNVMPRGAHHSFHVHPLSVISGTYYVQIPKKASVIQLEDPRVTRMMATPPKKKSQPPEQAFHFNHAPQEGDLVLFESWLRHQVPAQQPAKERISVSFNYSWRP